MLGSLSMLIKEDPDVSGISLTTRECHGLSNHQRLDCPVLFWFNWRVHLLTDTIFYGRRHLRFPLFCFLLPCFLVSVEWFTFSLRQHSIENDIRIQGILKWLYPKSAMFSMNLILNSPDPPVRIFSCVLYLPMLFGVASLAIYLQQNTAKHDTKPTLCIVLGKCSAADVTSGCPRRFQDSDRKWRHHISKMATRMDIRTNPKWWLEMTSAQIHDGGNPQSTPLFQITHSTCCALTSESYD